MATPQTGSVRESAAPLVSASSIVFDRDVEDGPANALESVLTAQRRIDVLCNRINLNVPDEDTDIVNVPLGTWDRIIGRECAQCDDELSRVIPAMLASGGGVIVNISSTSGSSPEPGNAAYAVSKAALNQLTAGYRYPVGSRQHPV